MRQTCIFLFSLFVLSPLWATPTDDGRFVLPSVPDSLTDSRARLNYTLEHFWETYAFADTTAANQSVGEEGFANFARLLQLADTATSARSIALYLQGAFAHESLRTRYEELIERYLFEPASPLRNDVAYACFLRQMLPYYGETEAAQRARAADHLLQVTKNQPGQVAADFTFTDSDGHAQTLHQVAAELTVMVFYDPDCDRCQQLLPQLQGEPLLQRHGIRVLLVNTALDTAPHQLYYLPSLPSIYLLDRRKRVLLKDVPFDTLLKVVERWFRVYGSHE